jgi:hypothetical protein
MTIRPSESHYYKHLIPLQYQLLSRHQNAGQNRGVNIGKRCFKNVAQLRYFGNEVKKSKPDSREIKTRLTSGNAC